MRRKLTSWLLTLCMAVMPIAAMPVAAFADEPSEGSGGGMGGSPSLYRVSADTELVDPEFWIDLAAPGYEGGDGSEGNPYQIASAEQLALLADQAQNDDDTTAGIYYILTGDIDLSGHGWIPIAYFKGNLDGQGHRILNMTIDQPDMAPAGLIATADAVSITDVGLANVNITGYQFIGALVGWINGIAGQTVIRGCFSTGTVSAEADTVGGLIGWARYALVDNCYTNCSVSNSISYGNTGGLLGDSYSFVSINNSYAAGTVTNPAVNTGRIGGLVGGVDQALSGENNYYNSENPSGYMGYEKTLAQMKEPGFVDLLNGSQSPAPWSADTEGVNDGFPVLAWQLALSPVSPPQAENVSISGTGTEGEKLTGLYSFKPGSGGADESGTTFRWLRYSTESTVFSNENVGGVNNTPTADTVFTLTQPTTISCIQDYHWNNSYGTSAAGQIGVRDQDGTVYGPWQAEGLPGYMGVTNAYWRASPYVVLPAGTYTVIDSEPTTWSQNSESMYQGFTLVRTAEYEIIAGAVEQAYTASAADVGYRLQFEVTVRDEDGNTGEPAHSQLIGPVEAAAVSYAPTVVTSGVSDVTVNTATVKGNVTSDGGIDISERGFVYSYSENPIIGGAGVEQTQAGNGSGEFAVTLTGLEKNKTYHIRAYAVNTGGTSYGDDISFTTLRPNQAPTITSDWNYTDTDLYFGHDYPYKITVSDEENTENTKIYSSLDSSSFKTSWIYSGAPGTQYYVLSPLKNVLSEGDHTLRYYAVDSGGASSEMLILTFRVTEEPVVDNGGGNVSGNGGGNSTHKDTFYASVTEDKIQKELLTVKVDTKEQKGTVSLDASKAEKLFKTGSTPIITMPDISGVKYDTLELPAESLMDRQEKGRLTLTTGLGRMVIPNDMLLVFPDAAGKIAGITIGQGDMSGLSAEEKSAVGNRPCLQLTLTLGGRQTSWSNPDSPIIVSIPYTPTVEELKAPENIIVWYVDGSGSPVCIPNGHYDSLTGTVTFTVTHFSQYAVGYNNRIFADANDSEWYARAVSFIAARQITSGTGGGKFSPDVNLTRGEFLVMLMRAYGIDGDKNPQTNFSDAGNKYYTGYLAAAKRLGITNGTGGNQYDPDREITRQEMFTLLYQVIKSMGDLPERATGKSLTDFSDSGQVASWAKDAVTALCQAGIVGGNEKKLLPEGTATRAEMAQVLFNLLSK